MIHGIIWIHLIQILSRTIVIHFLQYDHCGGRGGPEENELYGKQLTLQQNRIGQMS